MVLETFYQKSYTLRKKSDYTCINILRIIFI